mmetsp:Transcript_46109/g.137823  ORF Transcript_46109/g.137823 Transcript_46109/m.137823 type:complete len:175 (-) Transcript_46109:47-571(-)
MDANSAPAHTTSLGSRRCGKAAKPVRQQRRQREGEPRAGARGEGERAEGCLSVDGVLARAGALSGEACEALLPALRDAVQQVLQHREELEAGKKVILECTDALPELLPAGSGTTEAGLGDSAQNPARKALLNRALRRMSRLLPGCTWTVDHEHAQVQVHLGDMRRFQDFCKRWT